MLGWPGLDCSCVFRFVMRNIGDQLTPQEVEDMIKEADHDSDGRITYDGKISHKRSD